MEIEQEHKNLIRKLKYGGFIKNEEMEKAFTEIDRVDFVLEEYEDEAYKDIPLPILCGQTISQPSTVAFMLDLLDIKKDNKILDIGSGSGWTTALLADLTEDYGSVIGLEINPELVKFGQDNLAKYTPKNAKIIQAKENIGLANETFDRILVSAASIDQESSKELVKQLKIHGKLVMPIKNSIYKFEKISKTEVKTEKYPGFIFVPLITSDQNSYEK